jgi:hypothetical protein
MKNVAETQQFHHAAAKTSLNPALDKDESRFAEVLPPPVNPDKRWCL